MKKRWFTLIEMMIVIVIVAILLAISLWISGNRIQILKNKSVQEQFVYTYNSLFSRNLLTNYYDWQLYDKMTIYFTWGNNNFLYCYNTTPESCEQDKTEGGTYKISALQLGNTTPNTIDIKFEPYVLWCKISNETEKILTIKLQLNDNEDYCMKINPDLCKLEKTDCQ